MEQHARQTLRKSDKLQGRKEFDELKRSGTAWKDAFFTILILPPAVASDDAPRCGVVCSRRLHRRAVVRNRVRRLVFEAFRTEKHGIMPCRILVIPPRAMFETDMPTTARRLRKTLARAGFLRSGVPCQP